MSKGVQIKTALIALLIAAGSFGHQGPFFPMGDRFALTTDWFAVGLLLFGVINVLLEIPGTRWVRMAAIAAAVTGLVRPSELLRLMVLLAWLVWPPAFMVARALAIRYGDVPDAGAQEGQATATRARISLAAVIGAVAVASLAYRAFVAQGLQQTAALFVGLPALLATVVIFSVSPRSATGVACKAVTVGLLVSLLFLDEGILCVVMSAPLFYVVAVVIATAMDFSQNWRPNSGKNRTLFSCLIVLAMVPMSLEGVTGFTTFDREASVSESRIVHGSPAAVERALFESPRFDRVRPLYLRAGFPSPASIRIDRSADRVRWVIEFRGGEMRVNGMEARTGDLILELAEARSGLVRWRAVSDTSHMTHFLMWREAVVQWEPIDADTTRVTWTLRYRRDLDPAWYFGPMERYAVGLAAGYLIVSVATP